MARLLLISLVLLTGCGQMYWTRPDATYDRFAADHRECLGAAGFAVADRPGFVVVPESGFRACMSARGWGREQWTSWDVPPGRFRGLEDFPSRPIQIDTLPEQPERAMVDVTDPRYFIQPDSRLRYGGPQSTPKLLQKPIP